LRPACGRPDPAGPSGRGRRAGPRRRSARERDGAGACSGLTPRVPCDTHRSAAKPSVDRRVLEDMRLPALVALVAVAGALAACGGSDSAKSGDASTVVASAKKAKVGNVIVD